MQDLATVIGSSRVIERCGQYSVWGHVCPLTCAMYSHSTPITTGVIVITWF